MAQISLTSRLKKIEKDLQDTRTEFLLNMAEDIINTTLIPNGVSTRGAVDTGAYITSHSIRTTRGAGRSRSSHGKPGGQDPEAKAAEAMDQLLDDIAALPADQEQVYFTNASPHANVVEYVHGYNIYNSVRSRANNHLKDAINTIKARS